jgi:hypothetical protein
LGDAAVGPGRRREKEQMRRFWCVNRWTAAAALLAMVALAAPSVAAAGSYAGELPLTLSAFAVNREGYAGAETGRVDITIERWSTAEEVKTFEDTIVESGSDALLEWLEDIEPRAGYIQVEQSLGWDIHFATYDERASGGLKIVFVTDRPMSYWEVTSQTRSSQYEFIFCEIRIDEEGEGQGKLSGAAQITYNELTEQIEMENFSIEPVRLQTVEVVDSGSDAGDD